MVKLIPVIDFEAYLTNALEELPEGPSSKFANEWDNYNQKCLRAAGFSDLGKPYKSGTTLYSLEAIGETELTKIVVTELNEAFEDGRDFDNICAFAGGYILSIGGTDILLPQCCGDLRDIQSWRELLTNEDRSFWIGHPSPKIIKENGSLTFDLEHPNVQEPFNFAPEQMQHTVSKADLQRAIGQVEKELKIFSLRLQAINQKENLNVANIEQYFIYGKTIE